MFIAPRLFAKFVILLCFISTHVPLPLFGMELPEGVRPLFILNEESSLASYVSKDTIFLNDPGTIENFLKKLEGAPPDWKYLYGSNVDERYDRLFDEVERRDEARAGHRLLNQHIAFVWHGNLTSFRPQHKGFGVAIGPLQIQTSWGIVRFKIANAPFEMVAVPPADQLENTKTKRARGDDIDIHIIYSGTLMEAESVLYDFSTEKEGEGMILPIVVLDHVDYILRE